MNKKFDELTKQMAQSVTRRGALKKFGAGLAGMALAAFGLASKAQAATNTGYCIVDKFSGIDRGKPSFSGYCLDTTTCQAGASNQCKGHVNRNSLVADPCGFSAATALDTSKPCSF